MRKLTAFLGLGLLAAGANALAQDKPPVRFDNWLFYQKNVDDSQRWQYRPRFYIPFNLDNGGVFTQRIDLPMYYTNKVGQDNANGDWKSGIGDWFIEETYLSPEVSKNVKWSTSLRFVFPTGGNSPFGGNQYTVAPSLGLLYSMPEKKMTFNPLLRYFYSYHAAEDNAGKVRRLDIFPQASFGFGEGWTLQLYPENPIDYNYVTGKWFVDIDALLVKRMSKKWEFGFGGAYALKKDDPQFKYIVQGRVTFFF
ncbi:MAG TPA: hypothetical protein VJO54_11875 [Burkholderiales bacterium]|nr:hypothetical protein [Burkholderiales bacterium]